MHALTLRAQAQPATLPRRSLQLQQRLWRAQVLESCVSARSRLTRRPDVHTFCSPHIGFHQQRLAADIRTGPKSADFKTLEVEIRYYFSARLVLASDSVMPTSLVHRVEGKLRRILSLKLSAGCALAVSMHILRNVPSQARSASSSERSHLPAGIALLRRACPGPVACC